MNETEFRIFNQVFALGAELLYAVCLTLYLRPFVMGRRKLLLVSIGYLFFRLLCDGAAIPQGIFGLLLIVLPTAASGVLGLEKAMAFLLALLYWNTRTSSGLMAESLFYFLDQWIPVPVEPLEAIFLRSAVLLAVFLTLHASLLAVMLYALQQQIRKQRMPLHGWELCYLSLVPTTGILFGQMIPRLLIEFKDGVLLQLYERHPAFLAVVPMLALLFYAGTYLTIVFQQRMAALREEQATYFMERQQTQALRERIHEAEQFYTRVRQLKHEMRGHMNNIKGLVQSKAYASLEEYISQMDTDMNSFELTVQTGNPVTDVIVSSKQRQCMDRGIRFQIHFHYPGPGGYDAFDIGIILQNLLQNALEACEKVPEEERFISLTSKRNGHFFLIEVKNSFAGEIMFGPDGLPATTKSEDAPLHGLGLSNVRREAEKYMGELELRTNRQEFAAAVLLQERSSL